MSADPAVPNGEPKKTLARIDDLSGVEVEHLVSATTGAPLVKIRAIADSMVLVGQVDPAGAREIAAHLEEAAARSEYEVDLLAGLAELGLDNTEVTHTVLHAVRSGEQSRMTDTLGMTGEAS